MIQNSFRNVKRLLGSLFSNARAREGWGKHIYPFSFSKISGSPAKRVKQAGKKEGGLGEGIFARLLSAEGGMGVGKRFRNSAVSRMSKQKNFRFLN